MVKWQAIALLMFCFSCATTQSFSDNSMEKLLTPLQENCIVLDSTIECPKDTISTAINGCIDIWGGSLTCNHELETCSYELTVCQTKPKKWHESRILWGTVGIAIGTILGISITQ